LLLEYFIARCILWVIVNAFKNNKGFVVPAIDVSNSK
jgi:hypothetical protein